MIYTYVRCNMPYDAHAVTHVPPNTQGTRRRRKERVLRIRDNITNTRFFLSRYVVGRFLFVKAKGGGALGRRPSDPPPVPSLHKNLPTHV